MRINKVQPTFVDIDGTLIIHLDPKYHDLSFSVKVEDPLGISPIYVEAHHTMIRLLKEEHQRGACIKVWSRGGWEWAQNVIIALKLENYVDEVMDKPMVYFDDVPIEQWLTNRVYLPPGTPYKGQ